MKSNHKLNILNISTCVYSRLLFKIFTFKILNEYIHCTMYIFK